MPMNLIGKDQNEILRMGDMRPGIGKTGQSMSTELRRELVKGKRDTDTLPRVQHTEMMTEETGERSQEPGEEKVRGSNGCWSYR